MQAQQSHMAVGTSVIHPLHGLGLIEAIETRDLLGEPARFAVVKFGNLQMMANLDRPNHCLRAPIAAEQVAQVFQHLRDYLADLPLDYNQRHDANWEKLMNGDVRATCEVIKSLYLLGQRRRLGSKDLSMLEKARKVLAQELQHVAGGDLQALEREIELCCHSVPQVAGRRDSIGGWALRVLHSAAASLAMTSAWSGLPAVNRVDGAASANQAAAS